MINIFRKSRKSAQTDNKWIKYIKYALGEILLVVLGILIALQVNKWNENRKNRDAEQVILVDLKIEIDNNIIALKNVINEHTEALNAAKEVKSLMTDPLKLRMMHFTSLDSLMRAMASNWTYDPKLGILKSTINSGKIDLIRNKEIKYALASTEDFIRDALESTMGVERVRESHYWPMMASNNKVIDKANLILETKKMLLTSEFVWWTKYCMAIRQEGLDEENQLLSFFKSTSKLIDKEIGK